MKALVVRPKNSDEYKFISHLFMKLGIEVSHLSNGDLEDIGMSKLLAKVDKTKKVTRREVIRKLSF